MLVNARARSFQRRSGRSGATRAARLLCATTLASFQTQQQGMLMSIALPDSRALLRLTLASIALALGLGRAAVASEVTTPVEQLHAGLMAIMKAGKTAPFRQRYDMIAPVIGRTFDLEVILRQVIGPRLAALRWGMPFGATRSRPTSPISTPTLVNASRSRLSSGPPVAIGS